MITPNRVYAVQASRTLDISDARRFGELTLLLPRDVHVHRDQEFCVRKLAKELRSFAPNDYLLLFGDPFLVAYASIIVAGKMNGCFHTLWWMQSERRYIPMTVEIPN